MIDCIVCDYWYQRIERSRASQRSDIDSTAETASLIATLNDHQWNGACARKFPRLLTDLREVHAVRPSALEVPEEWLQEYVEAS